PSRGGAARSALPRTARGRRETREPGPCSRAAPCHSPCGPGARWLGVPARARRRCSSLGPTRVQEERRGRPGWAAPYASDRNLMSAPSSDRRAEFLARAQRGGMVPVVREVVLDADTPVAAFAKIARPPFAFLLESLVGGERWARYTFMGTEPREVWRYRGAQVERWTPATGWEDAGQSGDPIGHLATRLRALPTLQIPGLPRFTGGAVGYWGYDLVRSIERLPAPPPDTLGVPDAVLMIADSLVILDNLFGRAIVLANVEVPANSSA